MFLIAIVSRVFLINFDAERLPFVLTFARAFLLLAPPEVFPLWLLE